MSDGLDDVKPVKSKEVNEKRKTAVSGGDWSEQTGKNPDDLDVVDEDL